MSSERLLYWVMLAVMALFVGNHFAAKYKGTCLADRVMASAQHLGAETTQFAAIAESIFSETPSSSGSQPAFAEVPDRLAYVQARLTRRQVACARQQAQQARMIALQQVQHLRILCPRQSITVELPRMPQFISQ
jgi:hypothetical protein